MHKKVHFMRSSKKKSNDSKVDKSIDLFRTMIDSCPVWISFLNKDGKYLIANDYYTKTFNLPLSKVEGHNFKEFFPPDLYVKHKQLIERCFQKGENIEWEDQHTFKKNQTVFIYGIYTPLINDDGSINGLAAFGLDITKLKQAEFELKKQHDHLEKKVAERTAELEQKTKSLEETNIALRVLLDQRDKDKKQIEKNMLYKIEKLIFPYLDKLKEKKVDSEGNVYLNIIESNLKEITSTISPDLLSQFSKLTPAEIEVADLIRRGKTTKEIAQLLRLATATIATHRKNIRKKLSLTNKKMNLQTVLATNQK